MTSSIGWRAGLSDEDQSRIRSLIATVEDQIMEATDDPNAVGNAQLFPIVLSGSGPGRQITNFGGSCLGDVSDNFSGRRIANFDNVSY